MDHTEEDFSLSSDLRIQKLIDEAELEISKIQPEIDYLESCVQKLDKLKHKKNKLLSLKASLKVVLNQSNITNKNTTMTEKNINNSTQRIVKSEETSNHLTEQSTTQTFSERKLFIPELALAQVKNLLRPNKNLNYEIYKAVVFNGGEATTDDIKEYLIKNRIKQPKTGKFFDDVELKDISSRANYLVRKNILTTSGPGVFISIFGYNQLD